MKGAKERRIESLKSFHLPAIRWIINKKLFKYRTAGVREYWIVDPMKPQRVGG